MKIGLPQGFVEFGTSYHKVLLALHETGDACHNEIMTETRMSKNCVATSLQRLQEHGFIFFAGKLHAYDTGLKTQKVWSLKKKTWNQQIRYKEASSTERMRHHRKNKAAKAVNSIFNVGRHHADILQGLGARNET